MHEVFDHPARARLATLPTPLEAGPLLADDGPRLWVKRDDLTGLGGGGNKARKLEFLCGAALADGAQALVTVGAAQSNHCRMTAAAGARLGLDVHLVLSGDQPSEPHGNQLLSTLFGANLHFTGAAESHWGELEIAREALVEALAADGLRPYAIPIGGSTAVGAVGYAVAFVELLDQCAAADITPSHVVFTSSSGGTHAGLLAGRAAAAHGGRDVPDVVAIGVAKGVNAGHPDVARLANEVLTLVGSDAVVADEDVDVDDRWMGDDYAVPTEAGDAAIRWAARRGGWLLDRTYSGKGFAGLLGLAADGRFEGAADVVFVHTGGWPALFTPDGAPGEPGVAFDA
jgi:1-aminocyclopropane-1-carboxylate deaminase/D-cysteine desulfhydrase-like pyridoxal-dependent ACC family enzyme